MWHIVNKEDPKEYVYLSMPDYDAILKNKWKVSQGRNTSTHAGYAMHLVDLYFPQISYWLNWILLIDCFYNLSVCCHLPSLLFNIMVSIWYVLDDYFVDWSENNI